jgi:hypothetical protein
MQTIKLYRYNRTNGGVTISPIKPETEYTELYRLVAEEGKALTDGEKITFCVDTNIPELWEEIDYIEPEEENFIPETDT